MSRATKDHREYLRKQLHLLLPKTSILETEEQTRPYECDGLTAYQQKPWLVVLPELIEQVQNILRLCHSEGVPVVARGAYRAFWWCFTFSRWRFT
jgi:glycolate oxidase